MDNAATNDTSFLVGKPRLTPMAWASRALVRRPVGDRRKSTAHETIVIDTRKCLQLITEGAAARRRRKVVRRTARKIGTG
jgi:hypothetical protein